MSKSAIFDGKPVNIPKFKDNQPGTIPLIEWKQQLEQHAQEDTNNVGVRVLWGTTTAIPSGANQDALKSYYHDLIVWPDRHREKNDKYRLVPFGPDQEGSTDAETQPGDITPEGIERMNAFISKASISYYHLILALTDPGLGRVSASHSIVKLHRGDPTSTRLKNIWAELNTRFDSYPRYVVLEVKSRMSSLLIVEISKGEKAKYRSWIPTDDMEATLTSIELLREKYIRVVMNGDESDTSDVHDCAKYDTIRDTFSEAIESHGYETVLSDLTHKIEADKLKDEGQRELHTEQKRWDKFKVVTVEKAKRLIRQSELAAEHKAHGEPASGGGGQVNFTTTEEHNKGKQDCHNWTRNGKCRFGDKCRFAHDPAKKGSPPQKEYDSNGIEVCRAYKNTGRCRFGKDCTFAHVVDGKTINKPKGRSDGNGNGGGGAKKKAKRWNKKRADEYATNQVNAMVAKLAANNPTLNLQMPYWHVLSSAERMGVWEGGLIVGCDTDACMNLTFTTRNVIDLEECEPFTMTGLGGATITIKQRGTWVLFAKVDSGSTVIICTDVYYHPDAGCNVLSMTHLYRQGFGMVMGYDRMYDRRSSTNSGHAIVTPSREPIWLDEIGCGGKTILALRVMKRKPDIRNLPPDMRELARLGKTVRALSQKELRQQRHVLATIKAINQGRGAALHAHGVDTDSHDYRAKTNSQARSHEDESESSEAGAEDIAPATPTGGGTTTAGSGKATHFSDDTQKQYDDGYDKSHNKGSRVRYANDPSTVSKTASRQGETPVALTLAMIAAMSSWSSNKVDATSKQNYDMQGHVLFNYGKLTSKQKSRLWLRRFAYPGIENMISASKNGTVQGLEFTDRLADDDDETAARARFKQRPHHHSETDYSKLPPLHSMSIDQVSGFKCKSISGCKSAFIAICLATNWIITCLVRTRSEFPFIVAQIQRIAGAMGLELKHLRGDSAPEIQAGEAAKVAAAYDILITPTGNRDTQSGAKHESAIQRVIHRARAMMLLAPWLPRSCWALALLYAAFVLNVTPTKLAGKDTTPYERVHGRKPDLKKLGVHVFGCKVVYGMTKAERMATDDKKMHELTFNGYFVGYSGNLILVYTGTQVVTGHREKTAFFEGAFTARNPPSSPSPIDISDQVATEQNTVEQAHGTEAHDAELDAGEGGLPLVRSERQLRPPADVYGKILRDFSGVKINDLEVFDEEVPPPPADSAHENSTMEPVQLQSTASTAETVIDQQRSKYEEDKARKLEEYKDKTFNHPDGTTGKVIGVQLRRPNGEDVKKWYLQVRWSDGTTSRRPADEADDDSDSDIGDNDTDREDAERDGEAATKRVRRSPRHTRRNASFTALMFSIFAATGHPKADAAPDKSWPTPKSVFDCMAAHDYKGWWLAMRDEYQSWRKLNVFEIIDKKQREHGRNTYPLQDIYKRKYKPDGMFDKWKLRLCVLGNLFRRGVDCIANTFAPTVSASAARLFFALAVQFAYPIWSLDVKTAYLTAPSSGKYYTFFPNIFRIAEMTEAQIDELHKTITDGSAEAIRSIKKRLNAKFDPMDNRVLAIIRSVYGDPAAGRMFYLHFREVLKRLGWHATRSEQCLYVKKNADGTFCWLISFVDDASIAGPIKYLQKCIKDIQDQMEITLEKGITAFLGLNIEYNMTSGYLIANVPTMINDIVKRFSKYMQHLRPRSVPATPGLQMTKATDEEVAQAKELPYQELCGALCWVITWVRIECSTIMSMLGQHNARWSKAHFEVALGVLKYLEGTANHGLKYTRSAEFNAKNCITGYSDADLAGDIDTRRSRTGKLVLCAGGPITSKSSLQNVVQLSTAAAETIALNDTVQDVSVIRNTLAEMGLEQAAPTTVFEDNQAAVAIANSNTSLTGATKHLQMRDLKIKEMIESGTITVEYCPTTKMLSDLFTKNLNHVLFKKFSEYVTGYETDRKLLFIFKTKD